MDVNWGGLISLAFQARWKTLASAMNCKARHLTIEEAGYGSMCLSITSESQFDGNPSARMGLVSSLPSVKESGIIGDAVDSVLNRLPERIVAIRCVSSRSIVKDRYCSQYEEVPVLSGFKTSISKTDI
ncbi:hypothetical protein NPIL_17741 [Nephila pilipes]|uniref:Uncharacterized protein n=1 Tax=Nephila pilipes TaxID=299642 RepID=A0A8X6JDF3_NEPPI|nr:hypothetical protein NPIL_17741 [Nephila pilipes]